MGLFIFMLHVSVQWIEGICKSMMSLGLSQVSLIGVVVEGNFMRRFKKHASVFNFKHLDFSPCKMQSVILEGVSKP
jgi:hypothetical protein